MNPLAWVVDALKVPREPMLPEALEGASPLQLAEAKNRLQEISRVAYQLRLLIDAELAGALQGSALNYGGQIIRASNGRGSAKVKDDALFWFDVVNGLQQSPRPYDLLAALFPASSVRLTALPKLEAALGLDEGTLKTSHIVYDPPTSPLSVMPSAKAPKYLQDLEEGELR